MAWARKENISVISTCEIYPKNGNGNGNGNGYHHCVEGSDGQKKIRYTLFNNHISFPAGGSTDLPTDLLLSHRQVILNKRCVNPFDEPRIERLLSEIRAEEFIVIGASAEGAVEATALGLLQRGRNVTVVVDALGLHDQKNAKLALRKMEAKGARLVEAKRIAGVSHLKQVRICGCDSCQGKRKKVSTKVATETSNSPHWGFPQVDSA
jgi:nicotinamidase-related amidase